ncbi:mg2+ transporter [Colletotrichum chrysophilum]|uniref:Mg2+ transporter n=2 Tax=Colletotrichum chrysophilum TaxID=1836956 RepID=A0AAD9A890_9PEZI|nr:mg2+ transporter [Colletotrichum chrysophilum]
MTSKPKQIRFEEDGFEDWPDSRSSSPTPSVSSFHRGSRPEKGTTRIPARIVSKRALLELGYPFAEDGDTIIVQLALGPNLIDGLLRLSESIRNSGQGTSEYGDAWKPKHQSKSRGFDWISVDAPVAESPAHSGNEEEQDDDLESVSEGDELGNIDGPVVHSGILPLDNTKYFTDNAADPTSGRLAAWKLERSDLIMSGAVTQLYAAHAAEFYMDSSGNQRVTLVCPRDDGYGMGDPSLIRMRWLFNSSLGRYPDEDMSDTEPVTFISTQYLILEDKPAGKRQRGNHYKRTLREVLYGYDDETTHYTSQGAQNVDVGGSKSLSVQASQVWTLVLGSDLIITYSGLASSEMQQNLISIDTTLSSERTFTIRLIDEKDMCRYHVVITPSWKYVDFMKHAVALASKGHKRSNVTAYVLVNEFGLLVTTDIWLNLLSDGIIEEHVFGLRERNTEKGLPTEEYHALSAKLLATSSRSSLGRYSRRSSFQSEFRGSDLNTAMVLHPGMRRYRADSPSLSGGSTETDKHNHHNDDDDDDTLFFESHLGDEDLSLDDTIDLTMSFSELSSGTRQASTPGFRENAGYAEVPELFRLDKQVDVDLHQHETRRSSVSQREDMVSNHVEETRFTMPFRRMTRSMSFGTEASYPATHPYVNGPRRERRRNSSRGSSFSSNYAQSGRKPRAGSVGGTYSADQSFTRLPPLDFAEVGFVPFFAWRLTWSDDKRSRSEIEKTLSQLLDNLNISLERDKFGKWYKASFQCSEIEVMERFGSILRHDSSKRESLNDLGHSKSASLDDGSSSGQPQSEVSADSFRLHGDPLRTRKRSLEINDSNFSELIRGLRWAIDMSYEQEDQPWFVLKPSSAPCPLEDSSYEKDATALSRCQQCDNEKGYQSPDDALDHWHEHHANSACPQRAKQGRPFDDPCFVRIYQIVLDTNDRPSITGLRSSAFASSLVFLSDMQDLVERAEELHKMVTSVAGSDDLLNQNGNRPHLPSSLVEAFERIVSLFVLKAKELSWLNRFALKSDPTYGRHAQRRLDQLRRTGDAISEQTRGLLNRAKEDIMLLGTSKRDVERIVIAPIGPEFLAMSLISNLQNNMLIRGTDKRFDLINHYRNRAARLRFETNRRPKRNAFVQIHALEEELEALQMVVDSQQELWRAHQKLFSPLTFKCPTTDWFYYRERKSMFRLESKSVHRQQRRLAERERALWILRKRTRALRDDTKQRIEILDEGHGRAIRVFTIVTLFFLPLSFVTSFFGMNTTDVRDTKYDQRIFWSTALPVTFGVIGLAFMYGYKWDLVRAWVSRTFKSTERHATSYMAAQEQKLSWVTTVDQKDPWVPGRGDHSMNGWRERMSFLSAQRRRRKNKVPRKKTEDSLFRP